LFFPPLSLRRSLFLRALRPIPADRVDFFASLDFFVVQRLLLTQLRFSYSLPPQVPTCIKGIKTLSPFFFTSFLILCPTYSSPEHTSPASRVWCPDGCIFAWVPVLDEPPFASVGHFLIFCNFVGHRPTPRMLTVLCSLW